jgi:hypothetical protein
VKQMAYKKKHHHRRRHNPLGLSGGVVKDAAWVAGGAIAAAALPGMVAPSMATGWVGVAAKAAASVAASFLGRMVGGPVAAGEALKGGLAITLLAALKQGGVNVPGLGLYAPSWFGIPTASSQYLQAGAGNVPGFNRGGGSIVFPGPGGVPMIATPAAAGAAGVKSHLGYHRFRSRYAGGYG